MRDFAINPNMTAALLDKAIGHTETESGALAFGLGREEGVKRVLQHFRRHTGAGVSDAEDAIFDDPSGRWEGTAAVALTLPACGGLAVPEELPAFGFFAPAAMRRCHVWS